VKHGVLKHFHPMLGYDFHIPWPPGLPTPLASPVPYVTFAPMLTGLFITSKYSTTAYSEYMGMTMLQGTDIGPMIAHVGPPSLTLPIEMVFSASKSHFGVANYLVDGKPIAVSLLFIVNLNLNCGTPVPTPFGLVFALTTHRVDMTYADICGGLARMGADALMQWALGKLGNWVGDKIFPLISRVFGDRVFFNALMRNVAPDTRFAASEMLAFDALRDWLGTVYRLTGPAVGTLLGGPLGMDAGVVGLSADALAGDAIGGEEGSATEKAGDVVDDGGRAVGEYLDRKFPDDSGPGDYPLPSGDSKGA
jgi:hypothetical protein